MVCLGRPYHIKFFIGCFPQIVLGSFVNNLTQVFLLSNRDNKKYNHEKRSGRTFIFFFGT